MTKLLLDDDEIMQMCFVTDDLKKSIAWFSDLTGKETFFEGGSAPHDQAQATYNGQSAEITFRLALFRFANIDVEFLEPGPEPSSWRDHLDKNGPSFHHMGLRTRNMTKRRDHLEKHGHKMVQHGEFEGNNGRYEYFDAHENIGSFLELLEWDDNKEPQETA